jgi:hypothetical protein
LPFLHMGCAIGIDLWLCAAMIGEKVFWHGL